MAKLKVKRLFEDAQEHVDRKPGDVFECSDERAQHILTVLGEEFVELVEEKPKTTRRRSTKKAEE